MLDMISAEIAYLFRHAALRDAAYQLQLPSKRAALHHLALDILESTLSQADRATAADELARHARLATLGSLNEAEKAALFLREAAFLREAIEYALAGFHHEKVEQLALELSVHAALSEAERCRFLLTAADAARASGHIATAEDCARKALASAQQSGDADTQGDALVSQALSLMHTGRNGQAEQAFSAALDCYRAAGSEASERKTMGNLGNLYLLTARLQLAETTISRVLEMSRAAGDHASEAAALANLGGVMKERALFAESERLYRQALAIYIELGTIRQRGVIYANLANCLNAVGRADEAEGMYMAALALNRETGNRRSEGLVLGNLGEFYRQQGRRDDARRVQSLSLEISREYQNLRSAAYALANMAVLDEQDGRFESALALYDEALRCADAAGSIPLKRQVITHRGTLQLLRGERAGAEHALNGLRALDESLTEHASGVGRPLLVRWLLDQATHDAAALKPALQELEHLKQATDRGADEQAKGTLERIQEVAKAVLQGSPLVFRGHVATGNQLTAPLARSLLGDVHAGQLAPAVVAALQSLAQGSP